MTRTEQLMQATRDRIASRALVEGERLPSVRQFARTMGVSVSTVVEAYDRLAAEGVIEARRGSGFYVRRTGLPPAPISAGTNPRDRAVDPFWVTRQGLDSAPTAARPGSGWLPADWLPVAALRQAMRRFARADAALLTDYPPTRGSAELRRLLAARLASEGLNLAPDRLVLTGSGTEALDLVCRALLRPGDTVLVDDPCYFNFRAQLAAHQVRLVGVPYGVDGPDPEALEAVLAAHRPRLYVTNSALHNPTGAALSAPVAHKVLAATTRHGTLIVEDDIFADLAPHPTPRPIPRLAVLDGLDSVIRIGSFSKTISASIRCGYIAAGPGWTDTLIDLQIATRFSGPSPMAAAIIADVLSSGAYRKHLTRLHLRLANARQQTAAQLATLGISPIVAPLGGLYLWCRLPAGVSATRLAEFAIARDVVLAPGNIFSLSQSADDCMRFNVARFDAVLPVLQDGLRQT